MGAGEGRADRSRGGPRGPGGSLWDDSGQFTPPNAQYYAWGNAPGYGYGSSPAAWGGGGGGGGGTAPASAGGVPWPDGLDDAGNEIAPVTAGASNAATSSVFTRLIQRYGASAVSSAIEDYLREHEAEAALDERRQEGTQRTALQESTLDPFRGYMDQASDLSRIDLMDHDYTPTPLQLDPKYGAGLTLPPSQSYAPSALTRQVLTAARSAIAAGNKAPTLTDPRNYGGLPVVQAPNSTSRSTSAASAGTPPVPRVLTAATPPVPSVPAAVPPGSPALSAMGGGTSQRRRWPWETDDANSPWLKPGA